MEDFFLGPFDLRCLVEVFLITLRLWSRVTATIGSNRVVRAVLTVARTSIFISHGCSFLFPAGNKIFNEFDCAAAAAIRPRLASCHSMYYVVVLCSSIAEILA